jgi:hypothetical protein
MNPIQGSLTTAVLLFCALAASAKTVSAGGGHGPIFAEAAGARCISVMATFLRPSPEPWSEDIGV